MLEQGVAGGLAPPVIVEGGMNAPFAPWSTVLILFQMLRGLTVVTRP